MEMKKIAFVVVLFAVISTVLAHDHHHDHGTAPAPGPSKSHAPKPSKSDAASLGSIFGASIFSFVAYYLHFHV
ncbi:transmembrane protein, putative [Medicago truncatula]|uniref:Transmembrane protein, putative n=1 Tax=Medicago truncatula TaxID=3880 RepID=G7LEG8_MEDTR|nr:transmembrane protein, putative [Medicago truncatula]